MAEINSNITVITYQYFVKIECCISAFYDSQVLIMRILITLLIKRIYRAWVWSLLRLILNWVLFKKRKVKIMLKSILKYSNILALLGIIVTIILFIIADKKKELTLSVDSFISLVDKTTLKRFGNINLVW